MPNLWHVIRAITNVVNLSTPLGLLVAALGRASLRTAPGGMVLAENYRLNFPKASAFTVGNVVLVPHRTMTQAQWHHPDLLEHEDGHVTQYAMFLGIVFLPIYLLANAWSWARTGTVWQGNVFERMAGFASGGYPVEQENEPTWRPTRRPGWRDGRVGRGFSR